MTLWWALILVMALAAGAALTAGLVAVRRHSRPPGVTIDWDTSDWQWPAYTFAGPAVVSNVMTDQGRSYEIETSFRGDEIRLYYVAPSRVVAERRLWDLATERDANPRRRGASPR